MAQRKVTIEQMRDYVRSLDERLIEKAKYPDTWCDARINTAYEMTGTTRQPFLNAEALDLNPYVDDGTEKFQVDMEYDVIGYKRIYPELGGSTKYDSATPSALNYGMVNSTAVKWVKNPDQTVDVMLDLTAFDTSVTNTLTFEYYYFPTAPETETYMSADIYHMLRHGIEMSVWETLRDREKFGWAEEKMAKSAASVTNGLDIDVWPSEEWQGGFDGIGEGSSGRW